MERETDELSREGLRKGDRPDPQVESTTIEECQASEDKFWDDLLRQLGARPVRRNSGHTEAKISWMKTELAEDLEEKEEAWSSEEEDGEPGYKIRRFRDNWNASWSGADRFGDFEDTTLIPPMRYTDEPPNEYLNHCSTLQIFSVKISGIGEGLQWPLDVFGMVAIRDFVDQNRNIIFQRSGFNCQTLTEEDPNLVLTGPVRPVVLSDHVFIEVDLKVKGTPEDKTLFSQVVKLVSPEPIYSRLLHRSYTGKFSTLEFTLEHIVYSVEATISVRVVGGSWPDGFHGRFAACTTRIDSTTNADDDSRDEKGPIRGGTIGGNHKNLVLLGFGAEKGLVIGDGGMIELSRRVVCVKADGKLEVSVKAWQDDNIIFSKAGFKAKEAGKSYGELEVASCKMEVTVFWSLISSIPELHVNTISKNSRSS